MRKATTTEEIRKRMDAQFRPAVRGGEPFIQEFDEDGKPLNYNKVVRREIKDDR